MFCQCGCGQKAPVAKRNYHYLGHVKGQPMKYIRNHNLKLVDRSKSKHKKLNNSPVWKGGKITKKNGYVYIYIGKDHPMAEKNGYVREHRLVMAQALGRMLTSDECVHHKNERKNDNRFANLSLCSRPIHSFNHAELIRKYSEALAEISVLKKEIKRLKKGEPACA